MRSRRMVRRTINKPVEKPVQVQEDPVPEKKVMEEVSDEETDTSESEEQIVESMNKQQLRETIAPKSMSKLRPNEDLYVAIKNRYQELLKELTETEYSLADFEFSQEEKEILNNRVKLWLEYFVSSATFRDENVNLFDYMDSFTKSQKFI